MRYGYWLPIFGGWLRNVEDENMQPTWDYVSKLARRSEKIGFDITLIAELNRAGRAVYFVEPFVETRDVKSRNFTTYNRTADQLRVADILAAAALVVNEKVQMRLEVDDVTQSRQAIERDLS